MWIPVYIQFSNFISHKETKYVFEKGATLIVGGSDSVNNGQFSNGTGKSTIIEAIAVVLTGDALRKVNNKEVVMDGENEAELTFLLRNEVSNKTMLIRRVLFKNSKPAIAEVFINDEKKASLTSVNEVNKFILENLEISKEDLFSYYLIINDKFTPFFLAPDSKKKDIIARFSNTVPIDEAIEKVKSDFKELTSNEDEVEKLRIKVETSLTLKQEELEKIKSRDIEDLREQTIKTLSESKMLEEAKIKEIRQDIERLEVDVSKKEEDGIQWRKTLALSQQQLEVLKREKDKITEEVALLREKIEGVRGEDYVDAKKEIQEMVVQTSSSISTLEKDIQKNHEALLAVKKILSGTISCPNCDFEFILQSESERNLEDIKETEELLNSTRIKMNLELQSFRDTLAELKTMDSELDKEYDEKAKVFELELKQKQSEKLNKESSVFEKQSEVKKNQQHITEIEKAIEYIKSSITQLNTHILKKEENIENIQKNIEIEKVRVYEDETVERIEELGKLKEELSELDSIKMELSNEKVRVGEWEWNLKSFKNYMVNKSLRIIQEFVNDYLQKMQSDLSIAIDGFKELSTGKIKEEISISVLRGGVEAGSYGKFSAGERGRIDVAVIISLQQLINNSVSKGGLSLLCIDEALDSIEALGLESIIKSLSFINTPTLIVSQNNEVNVDRKLLVWKEKGVSFLKV